MQINLIAHKSKFVMKISVALCTYNGEKYIAEQLDSILKQTQLPDEIVICDDGSSDNTIGIIEELQIIYPIIKLYKNTSSLGIIKNFEKAINFCSNGIILLSDQDDIWFPHKVQVIVEYFNTHKNKRAVFHNLTLYKNGKPANFTIWDYISFEPKDRKRNNSELILYTSVTDNILTGAASAIIKREQLLFTDGIPFMLHDFLLLLQFANKNELGIIDDVLGYYRIHENQQVGAKFKKDENIIQNKNKYFGEDDKVKLQHLSSCLNNYLEYQHKSNLLKKSIQDLQKEIKETKKKLLKEYNFITRKRVLIRWYRNHIFHTNLLEVFKL